MILKAIKYFLKMKAKGVNVISIFRIKGHRIRASDKHLVYHFSIGTLLFLFVAVLLLLNIKQLMRTDWEHFSLLENGLTLSPYNFITILIATGVWALVLLTCKADQGKKSSGFRRFIIKWKRDCFISAVKSH